MERFRRESGMPAMPPREGVPRPSSLAGLNAVKEETEEFWDEGTHSILDIERVATAEDDGNPFGTIHPLTPAELAEVFGTSQPSAADFDRVHQPGAGGRLLDLRVERWTGRSVVIYKDGVPAEVFFWGFSGD